jgi:riboflavin biosynthesis pyrimidine reductase
MVSLPSSRQGSLSRDVGVLAVDDARTGDRVELRGGLLGSGLIGAITLGGGPIVHNGSALLTKSILTAAATVPRRWIPTLEVARLKREPGSDVIAHGGASFVQTLSRLGLIDEYRLVIQPVALGGGLPLFRDLPAPLRLELAEARTFPDGTAIHVYRPATAQ